MRPHKSLAAFVQRLVFPYSVNITEQKYSSAQIFATSTTSCAEIFCDKYDNIIFGLFYKLTNGRQVAQLSCIVCDLSGPDISSAAKINITPERSDTVYNCKKMDDSPPTCEKY